MKKIIFFLLSLSIMTFKATAQEPNWRCIQDNNNFIIFYPLLNKWGPVTNMNIQGAKRAEGLANQTAVRVTTAVVSQAPTGTLKHTWASGAYQSNVIAWIEPLCYY